MFRNTAISNSKIEANEEGSPEAKNADSMSMGHYRQRALSSGGRSYTNIKKINEERELEECHQYMQQCETRMRKAMDLRRRQQELVKDNMHNQTSRVNEKMSIVQAQQQAKFEKAFETNVENRRKIEEAKKKKAEEKYGEMEYNKEKKHEKLMAIHARQQEQKLKQEKRDRDLNKKWNQLMKKPVSFSGNLSFYESMATR